MFRDSDRSGLQHDSSRELKESLSAILPRCETDPIERQRRFGIALVLGLKLLPKIPSLEQVEEKAKQLADVFGYDAPLQPVIIDVLKNMTLSMKVGPSLVNREADHEDEK